MSTSQCGSIAYHALVLVGLFGCGARGPSAKKRSSHGATTTRERYDHERRRTGPLQQSGRASLRSVGARV